MPIDSDQTCGRVEVQLGRECRDWPDGAAEAAVKAMFSEWSSEDPLIIASDGSFSDNTERAGCAFVAVQGNKVVAEVRSHKRQGQQH